MRHLLVAAGHGGTSPPQLRRQSEEGDGVGWQGQPGTGRVGDDQLRVHIGRPAVVQGDRFVRRRNVPDTGWCFVAKFFMKSIKTNIVFVSMQLTKEIIYFSLFLKSSSFLNFFLVV